MATSIAPTSRDAHGVDLTPRTGLDPHTCFAVYAAAVAEHRAARLLEEDKIAAHAVLDRAEPDYRTAAIEQLITRGMTKTDALRRYGEADAYAHFAEALDKAADEKRAAGVRLSIARRALTYWGDYARFLTADHVVVTKMEAEAVALAPRKARVRAKAGT